MSYQIVLDGKKRAAGRFIAKVTRELQKAFSDEKQKNGLTQRQFAEKLGIDRAVVNRRLVGQSNLTLRSVAEMAEELNRVIYFELREKENSAMHGHVNYHESISKVVPARYTFEPMTISEEIETISPKFITVKECVAHE